jgi:hypothetical protein
LKECRTAFDAGAGQVEQRPTSLLRRIGVDDGIQAR